MKLINQDRPMNLNYKDLPCHGTSICNYCRNCSIVRSHSHFRGIIPKTFTGQFKLWTISACWPMTDVYVWLSMSVHCSTSSVRTALIQLFLTTEATDYSRWIIWLVNAGFLLLVVRGAFPGASGADVITETITDTCLTRSSIAPTHFYLIFFYEGLCPLSCLRL